MTNIKGKLNPMQPQPGDQFIRYDAVNKVSLYKRGDTFFKVDANDEAHFVLSLATAVSELSEDIQRWREVAALVGNMDKFEMLQLLATKSEESNTLIDKITERL